MTAPVTVRFFDADGVELESMPLIPRGASRPFSSGATGFMASGKVILRSATGDAAKFQVSCSVVEINSKSEALAAVAAEQRSKKQQLQAQIKALMDQAKHLA